MSVKFSEVFSQNQNKMLEADKILTDIKNHEAYVISDRYFCPSCFQAELTYVINTQYSDPYFKTHNYSNHEEGCNLASESLDKSLIHKINNTSNNYLNDSKKKGLLQRFSLMHQQNVNHYHRDSHSISNNNKTKEQKRNETSYSIKEKILQRKLNKYFQESIFEIFRPCPKGSYIPFVLYGKVTFKKRNFYGKYQNYGVFIRSHKAHPQLIFTLGLDINRDLQYIDMINSVLEKEVYAVMIGWIHVQSTYINFNFMGDSSFSIEMI